MDKQNENVIYYYNKLIQPSIVAPVDQMLKLYAYYKLLVNDNSIVTFEASTDIIAAFKYNALQQVSHMTKEEAEIAYIELAKIILNNQK